jgi:hypothetical protein
MTVAQTCILVEYDVDLDVQLVAGVVGLQVFDLGDGLGEAHGEVEEDVALVGRRGGAGEVADMRGAGAGPVGDDEERGGDRRGRRATRFARSSRLYRLSMRFSNSVEGRGDYLLGI